MARYSSDELKQKLGRPGWKTVADSNSMPLEGTLAEMVEAAHGRKRNGHAVGYLKEIATEIEVDLFQLEELWRHMGLPTV